MKNIEEYGAIGFDVDQCLVKYKIKPFIQLLYKHAVNILISEGKYNKEIFFSGRFEFGLKNLVMDKV